ncbi:hypothetical protein P691DRAFT_637954, partial [Macrolepiota fuliginosa MF-IS2]
VSVPRQALDHCDVCSSKRRLKVCSSCASAIYCSPECQAKDWKVHSSSCMAPVRSQKINLRTFYPIIAYLFDYFRRLGEPRTPLHPAIQSRILQAPVPAPKKARRPGEKVHQTAILGEE